MTPTRNGELPLIAAEVRFDWKLLYCEDELIDFRYFLAAFVWRLFFNRILYELGQIKEFVVIQQDLSFSKLSMQVNTILGTALYLVLVR